MTPQRPPHFSVLLEPVIDALSPRDGGRYVDGTFGAGGYTRGLLDRADCEVYAIDRDPNAIRDGQALAGASGGRLHLIEGRFGDMVALLAARAVDSVDGVTLDIGVSSMQLDQAERGFSFRQDGPLDMRMSGAAGGRSAADVVNEESEERLADIIYRYGEERASRRIARAIIIEREKKPITRTLQLADIVRGIVRMPPASKIDPATRTFQALRIYVNDELGELERGLSGAETLLAEGGRLAVVSFHSLEDRIVKRFLQRRAGQGDSGSRRLPGEAAPPAPSFRVLTRKPIEADESEIRLNPRARSARLRAAERTAAPAWPADAERRAA